MPKDHDIYLSVIVPVYKSSKIFPRLITSLVAELDKIKKNYEIVIICDNPFEDDWGVIKNNIMKFRNKKIIAILLSKNYGQHNAILAGINNSSGKILVTIDDDLQHNPEDIKKIIQPIENGTAEVVYAKFDHKKHKKWKIIGSFFANKTANFIYKKDATIQISSFRAFSSKVATHLRSFQGPYVYIDGLIWQSSIKVINVNVSHHERAEGNGSYSFFQSLSLWIKLVSGFSTFPLRVIFYSGILISLVALLSIFLILYLKISGFTLPLGWASLIVTIIFFGGVQIMILGLIGEYIGRVFLTLSKKPQYLIDDKIQN